MGGCCSTSSDTTDSTSKKKVVYSQNSQSQDNSAKQNKKNAKAKISENDFSDLPEVEGNFWFGKGIKKVKGYKCPWPFDELNKRREDFWLTKQKNKRVWLALKECCLADHETALQLLMISELACVSDNLQHVTELSTNQDFYIPNWVITDPEPIFDVDDRARKSQAIQEQTITLLLNNHNIKISNKQAGGDLKNKFLAAQGLSSSEYIVRLFFRGKEIADEHLLCFYDVSDGNRIMVIFSKK